MLSWRHLRGIFTTKPPIPTALILGALPILAILTAWLKPLIGVGSLSIWLKIAYFATIAFYVAHVVYALRCPESIKLYSSAIDRINAEHQAWTESNPSHRADIVRTQLRESEPARIELVDLENRRDAALGGERDQLDRQIAAIVDREWSNAVQQYLARTYDEDNRKHPIARFVATLFFAAFAIGILAVIVHRSHLVING